MTNDAPMSYLDSLDHEQLVRVRNYAEERIHALEAEAMVTLWIVSEGPRNIAAFRLDDYESALDCIMHGLDDRFGMGRSNDVSLNIRLEPQSIPESEVDDYLALNN